MAWSRPSFVLDHLDYSSLRIVLPTFIQVWVTVFCVAVPRIEKWFDNAVYLMQVLGFICSPGGLPIFMNIILAVTCFLAILFDWLCALIALAISTKLRGWPLRDQVADSLIREGVYGGPDLHRKIFGSQS